MSHNEDPCEHSYAVDESERALEYAGRLSDDLVVSGLAAGDTSRLHETARDGARLCERSRGRWLKIARDCTRWREIGSCRAEPLEMAQDCTRLHEMA